MLIIVTMKALFLLWIALCALPFNLLAIDNSGLVLEQINLARVSPRQYAEALERRMEGVRTREGRRVVDEAIAFLRRVAPLPPLAYSEGMASGASRHVADQGSHGTFGHVGSDHSTPWDRMGAAGKWMGSAGENISYGYADPEMIVATLIVDDGVRGRGHRKNIFNRGFGVAGIACGPHARFGEMCVIDFAGGFIENGAANSTARHAAGNAWSRAETDRI